jgi:hydrogenase maturation protein HypF
MNATLALSRGREIIASQHLGDLQGFEARELFRRTLDDLTRLFDVRPEAVAHDLHPDYFTTQLAAELGLTRHAVQHHHAHLAACMLENELTDPVLGITWDGTGYGPDGTVWGGELLLGGPAAYRRVGTLVPFGLPGGEVAVGEPWRTAVGLACEVSLAQSGLAAPRFDDVEPRAVESVTALARKGVRTVTTTSVGRLFDGVSAWLGLCSVATHQAHAAQQLEWRAWDHGRRADALPFTVLAEDDPLRIDWRPAVTRLVERRGGGESVSSLAAAFHHGLAHAAVDVARRVGQRDVALAGGVFCNRYLTELLAELLEQAGFAVHLHGQLPPTDGSLSVGQIWVAAHR